MKLRYLLSNFPYAYTFYFFLSSLSSRISSFIPKTVQRYLPIYRDWLRRGIPVSLINDTWIIKYPINNIPTTLYLRKNDSDLLVFNQVILNEGYKPLLKLFSENNISSPRIIDAGSNIGLTALYLKRHFPSASIACIEPSRENGEILKKNFESPEFKDILFLPSALWNRKTLLSQKPEFRDNLSWAFAVEETTTGSNTIQAITLDGLMKTMQWDSADLLKLDIEGAEAALFNDEETVAFMMSKFRIIALEIHEETISASAVKNCMMKGGMDVFDSGELTIGIKP